VQDRTMTNRKSYMRFRLVPKSMTLSDLERPKRTLSQKRCVFWSPYYQRQKCRPLNLVSGNIMFMGIIAGVPLGGGVKWQWGCRRRQFLAICVATSSETSEIKPAILGYMAICYPLSACSNCKINDLEWPLVPISRQNPFSTSKAVTRLPLR